MYLGVREFTGIVAHDLLVYEVFGGCHSIMKL